MKVTCLQPPGGPHSHVEREVFSTHYFVLLIGKLLVLFMERCCRCHVSLCVELSPIIRAEYTVHCQNCQHVCRMISDFFCHSDRPAKIWSIGYLAAHRTGLQTSSDDSFVRFTSLPTRS